MIETINHIAQSWWSWMGSMLWQVSLLILIVSIIDFFIRRWAWPQVRYALWLLILIKLILPPSWTLPSSLISRWQPAVQAQIEKRLDTPVQFSEVAKVSRIPSFPEDTMIPTYAAGPTEETAGRPESKPSPATQAAAAAPAMNWKAMAMAAWILGMGFFIALLTHRITRLRRWHKKQVERKTIPVWYYELLVKTTDRLKLGRLPAIVFSKEAKAPAVYGIFRPVLLLPASYLDSLSKEDAEHVLLHELAHLKRGDLWLHGLCLLLQIAYWFNPLLIWMRRQMKHVREICCDLTIANLLKEKTMKYRETLVSTARELLTEVAEPGMGLLGVFEDPFRLVARLKWLEKKTWRNRKLMTAAVVFVTLTMTAAVLPMGGGGESAGTAVLKSQTEFQEKEKERIENLVFDVKIKRLPPLYAAVLPRVGEVDEYEYAFTRMKELLAKDGIEPAGPPFGRYISDSDDVPEEEFVWVVGYPVEPGTKVSPPLEILRVSEQQVASATIEGILSTDLVWPKFVEAIKGRGYIAAYPPAYEVWHGESEGNEFWWKTEMQIQVFAFDAGYPGMDIRFKETDPFTAVVLPMQGSFAQLAEGAKILKGYIEKEGIQTTGPPYGRYLVDSSKVPPSQYVWELGYPVNADAAVEPPFEIRTIEGAKVAFTVLPGPPEPDYPWAPFILQIMLKGYLPAGAAMEIWHGDPKKTGDGGPRMELQIPVMEFDDLQDIGQEIAKSVEDAVGGGAGGDNFVLRKIGQHQDWPLLGKVSPDGSHISCVDWDTGDLAVRNLSTHEKTRITDKDSWEASDAQTFRSRWSPDGKRIAYDWWYWDKEPGFVGIREIGVDGGSDRTIYQVPANQLTQVYAWSSDGEEILVLRQRRPDAWIELVNVEDGTPRILKTLDIGAVGYNQITEMDLSPDGRFVAYDLPVGDDSSNNDIYILSVENQEEVTLVEHPADDRLIGFAPDGKHVLFKSTRRGSTDAWIIPLSNGRPAGAPFLLTEGIGDMEPLGFSNAGDFYFSKGRPERNVYIAELDPETGKAVRVPQEPLPHMGWSSHFPTYSPDGRQMAYISSRGPRRDTQSILVIRTLDSGGEREILLEQEFILLKWSPDGRTLLGNSFDGSNRSARSFLATIDAETGDVRVIKKCEEGRLDQNITESAWSKDGRSVFYVMNTKSKGLSQLFVRDLESASEKELYRAPSWAERFFISRSPDGRWLAMMNYRGAEEKTRTLRIISTDGKEIRELYQFEEGSNGRSWTAWTPDGKYVVFERYNPEAMWELWRIPFQGGEPERIGLTMAKFYTPSYHPNGMRLAFGSNGPSTKSPELWIMENFLPDKN